LKKTTKFLKLKIILISIILACASELLLSLNYLSFKPKSLNSSQSDGEPFNVPQQFQMTEFSEMSGKKINVNSINIELPETTWNLVDIEVNFTDITRLYEVKSIEDHYINKYKDIYNEKFHRFGRAVQLKLTEPSLIYGVYIYGYKTPNSVDISFQIRGYNSEYNNPNNTVYLSQTLNMSFIPSWYFQNFSSPIFLPNGNYYLVMNGSYIPRYSGTYYYWAYNDEDPADSMLYSTEYNNYWYIGTTGSPFLYKLLVQSNISYYPEDINMKVEINDSYFNITNGLDIGIGYFNFSNINYSPNNNYLHLPIHNNESVVLIFNISYYIKIRNFFYSEGSLKITENSENIWFISDTINRVSDIYYMRLNYSDSWYNITVNINYENITHEVTFNHNENYLLIHNEIIIDGALLQITANSPIINFNTSIPLTKYKSGQTIKITTDVPTSGGNITFIIFDPFGLEEYRETIANPQEPFLFSYELSINPHKGEWKVFIYWYSNHDAGVETILFSVISLKDPPNYSLILGVILTTIILGFASYQLTLRYRKFNEVKKSKIYDKFMDILNLNYIIISDKKSGLNLYEESFTGKTLSPTLITGYLNALNIFGIELTGSYENSQTIKLDFENAKIIMSDFKDIRIIFILKENPSENLLKAIKSISYDIDRKYGKLAKNFKGKRKEFIGMSEIIRKYFFMPFIYPLKIIESENIILNQGERELLTEAKTIMNENNINYIFSTFLMPQQEFEMKTAKIISSLIEKGIFNPNKLN
jgi:hypothetical protein